VVLSRIFLPPQITQKNRLDYELDSVICLPSTRIAGLSFSDPITFTGLYDVNLEQKIVELCINESEMPAMKDFVKFSARVRSILYVHHLIINPIIYFESIIVEF
jgi:hypothetical protein